jgi:hypothetical protein
MLYCSSECRRNARNVRRSEARKTISKPEQIICDVCGRPYLPERAGYKRHKECRAEGELMQKRAQKAIVRAAKRADPKVEPERKYIPRAMAKKKAEFDESRFHLCACGRSYYGDGDKCWTCKGIYPISKTTYNHTIWRG